MKILPVQHPQNYRGLISSLKPVEVGCYSLDVERRFCDDNSQLKFIHKPDLSRSPLNLDDGFETWVKKDYRSYENDMLKWMVNHQEEIKEYFGDAVTKKLKLDFVCFRGLLAKVCGTIYNTVGEWTFHATKHNSIIYLNETKTFHSGLFQEHERPIYWGEKFEQCLQTINRGIEPNTSLPVNPNSEFCIVLKGELRYEFRNHTLLYSAEVDGLDENATDWVPGSTKNYVELKTTKCLSPNPYRSKLLKWWLQSYIAGVPKLICGIRDDTGRVNSLEEMDVSMLPKISQAQNKWYPTNVMRFCCILLDFVKESVTKDDPFIVYKFHWKRSSPVICEELQTPSPECQVLTQSFISDFRMNLTA